MSTVTRSRPVSDLRDATDEVIEEVRASGGPLLLDRDGRPTAVLLSFEEYQRSERERAFLQMLARAEREIASGEGYDLEDVLADADAILRERGL